jgi:RHS repeat-associated protein
LKPAVQAFEFALSGVTVELQEVTTNLDVYFSAMRWNRISNEWDADVVLSNKSATPISGPLLFLVDSFSGSTGPLRPDGVSTNKSFYDFSGQIPNGTLGSSQSSVPRALGIGYVPGQAPKLSPRLFAGLLTNVVEALGFVRSLNELGQPMAGVSVTEIGPAGNTTNLTDSVFGVLTLGRTPGNYVWKFEQDGYLPVWRQASLQSNQVTVVPYPWLTARNLQAVNVSPLVGGNASNQAVVVQFGAGSLPQPTLAQLTQLSGQTLPFFLPQGWSPLQAFWLELSAEPTQPLTASLLPWGPISSAENAILAKFNPANLSWQALQLVPGNDTNGLSVLLPGSGAYALVVPDSTPAQPPQAVVGGILQASSGPSVDPTNLRASGTVTPANSPASLVPELLTATADLVVSNTTGALPSGTILRGEVSQRYVLQDGTSRVPPFFDNFVVAYQRPSQTPAGLLLHAQFPMRPVLLFGPDQLDQGLVHMDLFPPSVFSGGVLTTNGGLIASHGLRLLAGPGALADQEAVQLRRLSPTNFTDLAGTNFSIVAAFEAGLGALPTGHELFLQATGVPPNMTFVLARVLADQGLYGFEPRARLRSDLNGNLSSDEPATGDRLPGLAGAGQYVLMEVQPQQGVVEGIANDSNGQPKGGLPVRITGQPWLTFSAPDGTFKLLAPAGNGNLTVSDVATGDVGNQGISVPNGLAPINASIALGLSGLQVASITPSDHATNVPPVSSVVITFNRPINPATVTGTEVQLLGASNAPVAASFSLNLANTIGTLLPSAPLDAGTQFTVLLSTNIADAIGRPLQGQTKFSFTTVALSARDPAAQLIIYEPGATNLDTNVVADLPGYVPGTNASLVVVHGTPGSADPGVPVIIVNEGTGETGTVLSKQDGSFTSLVPGHEQDFISAAFVSLNGARLYIPVNRQLFDDGSVGLYPQGGALVATGSAGPVQLTVPPNALQGRTKFKLVSVTPAEAQTQLGASPDSGTVAGSALNLHFEGPAPTLPVGVSFPVPDLTALGYPTNEVPTNVAAVAAIDQDAQDGKAFEVLSQMTFTPNPGVKIRQRMGRPQGGRRPLGGDNTDQITGSLQAFLNLSPAGFQANLLFNHFIVPLIFGPRPVGIKGVVGYIPSDQFEAIEAGRQQSEDLGQASLVGLVPGLGGLGQVLFTASTVGDFLFNAAELALVKPLSGALVTVSQSSIPNIGPPGRVQQGMVYSTTGADGTFLAVAPMAGDQYLVYASHPLYRSKLTIPVNPVSFTGGSQISLAGVVFKNFYFSQLAESLAPPNVSIATVPSQPAAGQSCVIQITAFHPTGAPTIGAVVSSIGNKNLLTGQTIPNPQYTLNSVTKTTNGNTAIWTGTLSANVPVMVTLKYVIQGQNAAQNLPQNFLNIAFTGPTPPTPVASIPPPDTNDLHGPLVVETDPVNNGFVGENGSITLVFNKPIDSSVTNDLSGIVLSGATGSSPIVRLSASQKTLTVQYPGLLPNQTHVLTLSGPSIRDLGGKPLDQRPSTSQPDSFSMTFRTPSQSSTNLAGLVNGRGAVISDNFLYALDQAPQGNYLLIYDISTPLVPKLRSRTHLFGAPRDLVAIPQYPYFANIHSPPVTNDLVVVVGGDLDGLTDDNGNVSVRGQYLWVFAVGDGTSPQLIAQPIVTYRVGSAVTKVRWSAPYLAYEEFGADIQVVGMVNLQALIIGYGASNAERNTFPPDGKQGVDRYGDGEYVAPGDTPPLPELDPPQFYGLDQNYILQGTSQKMLDFSIAGGGGTVGITLTRGVQLDLTNNPTSTKLPPMYRTLAFNGLPLNNSDPTNASVEFGIGAYPRWVSVYKNMNLITTNGDSILRSVALVSLEPDSDNTQKLAVIDISLPNSPSLLNKIALPDSLLGGPVESIVLRSDGFLELAGAANLVVIDPSRLLVPDAPGGQSHPAIVDVIGGAGSTTRSFGTSSYGVHAVADGGRAVLIESPPLIQFVKIPAAMVNSAVLGFLPRDDVDQKVSSMRIVGGLPPANLKTNLNLASDLDPPNPALHNYVMVTAPGGSGPTINIGLEALNSAGRPLANRGPGYAPVRAVSDGTQHAIGQKPRSHCGTPIQSLTAYRMSNDPHSGYYNRYLSKPFALVVEQVLASTLAQLKSSVDREILSSGHQLRAFIDPVESTNQAIGSFAALVDTTRQMIYPVSPALANTLNQTYYPGNNPPPPGGAAAMPGTFGAVCAHSGEIRTTARDIVLPSPRMPIQIERQIGNQDTYDGPFGVGWDFNYNQRITELDPELFPTGLQMPIVARDTTDDSEIAASQDLLFHNGMGGIDIFKWVNTNMPPEYSSDPLVQQFDYGRLVSDYYLPAKGQGVFDLLVKFKDGRFERIESDGTRYRYTPDGRLETLMDRYPKNRHDLTYDSNGWLVRIDDGSVATPRFVQFGHFRRQQSDPDFTPGLDINTVNPFLEGKICRLLDYTGRDILYHYDEEGFLTNRLGFQVNGDNNGFAGRSQTFYVYNGCQFAGIAATVNGTPLFTAVITSSSTGKPVAQSGTGIGNNVNLQIPLENSAASLSGSTTSAGLSDGSTSQFQFDKLGNPTSVGISSGSGPAATTVTSNSEEGLLVYIRYPEGNSKTLSYDTKNPVFRSRRNLLSVTVDPGPRGGVGSTETYLYDSTYNQKSGPHTTADGFVWTYVLTPDKRDIATIDYGSAGSQNASYNLLGQATANTDSRGVAVTYGYDSATGFPTFRQLGINKYTYNYGSDTASQLGEPSSITLPEGAPFAFTYNANLAKVEAKRGSLVEEFAYDEQGRAIYHQKQFGNGQSATARMVYDAKGFLTTNILDGVEVNGSATSIEFDYTPDPVSRIQSIRHPQGTLQTFSYDGRGNMTGMTLGDYVEEYGYDLNNNRTTVKQGGDLVKQTTYDGLDRPITIVRKTGTQDETVTRAYYPSDALKFEKYSDPQFGESSSQIVDQIDEVGRTIHRVVTGSTIAPSYQYKYLPLSVVTTEPRMTTTEAWNSAGYTTELKNAILDQIFHPDGNGRIAGIDRIEDGFTFDNTFSFDAQDNQTSASDNLGLRFKYLYRADGILLALTNANGNATAFENSVLGEVTRKRRADGLEFDYQHDKERHTSFSGDPAAGFHFGYDTDIRLSSSTLRNGSATIYSNFDPRNMPRTKTFPGGTATAQYDLQKRLTSKTTTFQSTSYTYQKQYDARDRARIITFQQDGGSASTITRVYDKAGPILSSRFQEDGSDLTVRYTLNSDASRASVIYPSGVTVIETRDNSGRLTGVSDQDGNIISAKSWLGNNNPKTVDLGSAIQIFNQYDARGRLTASLALNRSNGAVLTHMRYQYDPANNLIVRQFLHRGGRADYFTYDAGERLSAAQIAGFPVSASSFAVPLSDRSYTYHATGLDYLTSTTSSNLTEDIPVFATNWTAHDDFLLPEVVDGFNRGGGDPMGNVTNAQLQARLVSAVTTAPVGAALIHNGLSDLVQISRSDNVVEQNFYEPDGLRYRRSISEHGTVTSDRRYIYDDKGRLLEEYEFSTGTNALVGRYYYASSDAPDAADLPDSLGNLRRYYFLKDHVGSIIAVADGDGNVVERVWYDPFGQPFIEGHDSLAPTLQFVSTDTNGALLIGLSEPVWTAISDPGQGEGIVPIPAPADSKIISVAINSTNLSGTLELLPSSPGAEPYSVFRFSPSQQIPTFPTSLVGWWPADGNVSDVAGGHNGTLKAGAATGPGLINQAFVLNGTSAYVNIPDDAALDFGAGDFTAALWASFNNTSGEQVLIEKWTQATKSGWSLIKMPDNSLLLALGDGAGNEVDVNSGVLALTRTNWIHYAVRRQGNQFTLFTNGVVVATGSDSAGLNTTNSLKFGSREGTSFLLNGGIDEVTLFSRALTLGEIRTVAGGSSIPGPVTVTLHPGMVADEWGNTNQSAAVSFQYFKQPDQVLYQAEPPVHTLAPRFAQSQIGSPFLFHGQYFDYASGLIYLRARFYDPYSGMFLEPDPMGYGDSVNLYAGMANAPVGVRDPSGLGVMLWELEELTQQSERFAAARTESALERVGGSIERAEGTFTRAETTVGTTEGSIVRAEETFGNAATRPPQVEPRLTDVPAETQVNPQVRPSETVFYGFGESAQKLERTINELRSQKKVLTRWARGELDAESAERIYKYRGKNLESTDPEAIAYAHTGGHLGAALSTAWVKDFSIEWAINNRQFEGRAYVAEFEVEQGIGLRVNDKQFEVTFIKELPVMSAKIYQINLPPLTERMLEERIPKWRYERLIEHNIDPHSLLELIETIR